MESAGQEKGEKQETESPWNGQGRGKELIKQAESYSEPETTCPRRMPTISAEIQHGQQHQHGETAQMIMS